MSESSPNILRKECEMKRFLLVSALVLAALARNATAQFTPVSPSDVLVNFDNVDVARVHRHGCSRDQRGSRSRRPVHGLR